MTANNNDSEVSYNKAVIILVIVFVVFVGAINYMVYNDNREKEKLEIEKLKLEIEFSKLLLNDSTYISKKYDNNDSIDRTYR